VERHTSKSRTESKVMKQLDEIVQTLNPRTKRYVKIDRVNGLILKTKKTPGPFKHVQIIDKKKYKH
jgi:hypothetical protein